MVKNLFAFLFLILLSISLFILLPKKVDAQSYQGQTCDTITPQNATYGQDANLYPSCNTTDVNSSGQHLYCAMYSSLPFGVCQFGAAPTGTATGVKLNGQACNPSVNECSSGLTCQLETSGYICESPKGQCSYSYSYANGAQCACAEDCRSGLLCQQYSGGVVSTTTFCLPPITPTPTSSEVVVPNVSSCLMKADKPDDCSCTSSTQCASGYCDIGTYGDFGTYTCKSPTGPTPTPPSTCNQYGIKSIEYNSIHRCSKSSTSDSATITCNDGTVKNLSVSYCKTERDWQLQAYTICSSHKTCPTPTPTTPPTPTATPIPQQSTPTPTPLSCDADRNGVTNAADYDWWQQEFTHQKTTKQADCNNDGTVDILDFNVWRDVYVLKAR
jgi:hypothetical protein